jgi:hypothetical protein
MRLRREFQRVIQALRAENNGVEATPSDGGLERRGPIDGSQLFGSGFSK